MKTRKLIRSKLKNVIKSLYVQCLTRTRSTYKWVYADFELEVDNEIEELTTISVEGEKKDD